MVMEKDVLNLEAEQIRGYCLEAAALKEEKDNLMFETKLQAASIMAMEKERDILNVEAEQIRGHCNRAAELKDEN
jgi:hypothetical protein